MAQGMPRRHLFDNGYPVSCATLLAGSEVLLAVSNAALRSSRFRLAMCLLRLADTSGRVTASHARGDCSHLALRDSRDNFNYGNAIRAAVERVSAGAGHEPGKLPACEEPHQP